MSGREDLTGEFTLDSGHCVEAHIKPWKRKFVAGTVATVKNLIRIFSGGDYHKDIAKETGVVISEESGDAGMLSYDPEERYLWLSGYSFHYGNRDRPNRWKVANILKELFSSTMTVEEEADWKKQDEIADKYGEDDL